MEENTTPQEKAEIPKKNIETQKKNKTTPILVTIIVLLLLVIVGAGAYYFGTQKNSTAPAVSQTQKTVENVTPAPTTATTQSPTQIVLASYTSTKLKDISFSPYTVSFPGTWVKTVKHDDITDALTLTKGDYSLKIYQAPMGGGGCVFKGDPPAEMSQDFSTKEFVEIKNGDITFRRVEASTTSPGITAYTLCANSPAAKNSFGSPTSFGAISYTTPSSPDKTVLDEMDNIIKTLKPATP